jgi:DNA modification methylase
MLLDAVYYHDASAMSEVADDSIAPVVTSPPYWNVKDYSLDGRQRQKRSAKHAAQISDVADYAEYLQALNRVWLECVRVLKPNGELCVNVPLMPIPKKSHQTHYTRDIVNIYTDNRARNPDPNTAGTDGHLHHYPTTSLVSASTKTLETRGL